MSSSADRAAAQQRSGADLAEDDCLTARIGRNSVAQNLDQAVANGALERNDKDSYTLPADDRSRDRTARNPVPWPYPCRKLLFLFDNVYERRQVPSTCRSCYKVKVAPRKVSQLVRIFDATVGKPYPSKFQPDMDAHYTSDVYGAYFYADGLEQARAIHRDISATLIEDSALDGVPITIKRGCTEYEMHCGPSDQYSFPDGLPAIEEKLLEMIDMPAGTSKHSSRNLIILMWVRQAFRIGDDSYLELTGGRRLFPETVKYAP